MLSRFRALRLPSSMWSPHLITLATATFLMSFGQGLFNGASTNFFVNTLNLSGAQVLWLAGIREIPGLALIVIAALIMRLPLSLRAGISVLLMGIGYGLYALVHSYAALLAVAVTASLGFHVWMPLQSSLAMGLVERHQSGRVMGSLSSVAALAGIVALGATALITRLFVATPLRGFYVVGGLLTLAAGYMILRLPSHIGATEMEQPRILLKRRYWLYYVLTFFEGSRTQVFGSFGTLVLVQNYDLNVWQISLLLLASSLVNFSLSPTLGMLLDRVGERRTLTCSYTLLAACFVGYATLHNAWALCALLVAIQLLVLLQMGLSTYVNRIAPPEELTPTLSAG
jgi:predicted MFS family arabinose efflux permease